MHPVTIGTAGHIDHGKSALVRALTGIDPDRLAEEQRRGMTLDLGFAHLDLPGGLRVGIVDVPGHEALVHNMLAGAGGIDLVVLVVDAGEGPMPQTREHLDILRFMPISGGVVVITKVDLSPDPEWLEAVEEEVTRLVAGTALESAPVVRVSARTGAGLARLVEELDRLAAAVPARPSDGPVRLPVDRSFTMPGFGTVVTGTLWSGTVRAGDAMIVLPSSAPVRVRGLQVHGTPVSEARAGGRVAVNVAGVEKEEVQRGDVLATPGAFRITDRIDVHLRLLPGAPALRQADRVHLHIGSGSAVARVSLVGRPRLDPGEESLARLRLDRPVVAVHGDPFVIRRYSPPRTLGGGRVIDPSPGLRRKAEGTLEAAASAGPAALVMAAVAAHGQAGMIPGEAAAAAGVDTGTAEAIVSAALGSGHLVRVGDRLFAASAVEAMRRTVEEVLRSYHREAPWRQGMPREDLKSRAAAGAGRLFDTVLADLIRSGQAVEGRGFVWLSGHSAVRSESDERTRRALLDALEKGGFSPPGLDELRRVSNPDSVSRMLQSLVDDGLVVQAADLRFTASTVEAARRTVLEMLQGGQEVTVASLRDRLGTSRRYALALMEYLDAQRVTRRVGDRRVQGPRAGVATGEPGSVATPPPSDR